MARYASVEPLSQRFRRKRGPDDGLWFAISGGRLGVDQFGQFAQLGGRRRRCPSMARNWVDLRSGCWVYRPWRWGKAPADRVSRTWQARPAGAYLVTAARGIR